MVENGEDFVNANKRQIKTNSRAPNREEKRKQCDDERSVAKTDSLEEIQGDQSLKLNENLGVLHKKLIRFIEVYFKINIEKST